MHHFFCFCDALSKECVPIIHALKDFALKYKKTYSFGIVLFQLGDGRVYCLPHFIDGLLDAEVDGFCFEVLMVLGVLSDAGGAERHEAAFWMGAVVLSLQKFVMA